MEIRLPQLGEGADSGTVVKVLVKEGDALEKDQPIIELENEKAVAPIPATETGTVEKIHVSEGQEISVGDLILTIKAGEDAEEEEPERKEPPDDEKAEEPESKPEEPEPDEETTAKAPPSKSGQRPAAAPSVRKMARELGIDLNRVRGSERGGRIVLEDLRTYVEWLQRSAFEKKDRAEREGPPPDFSQWGPVRREAITGLRKTISRRMTESWTTIPHVTQFDEADVTRLMRLLEKHAATYEDSGARLTLTSFVIKALVPALREHPVFNSSLDFDAGEIVFKEYLHIGVAVDSEHGLVVPVLRDVDKMSMRELANELQQLTERARERKLSADDMCGGSFTVSNQGGIGGGDFTPIVNAPEVAILGVGRGKERPVMRAGKIKPRVMLPLALSYDHRVADGAAAARFVTALVEALENFSEKEVTS